MMDREETISITTYVPARNNIDQVCLKNALSGLVRALYPEIKHVRFFHGNDNPEGINAMRIRTGIDQGTANKLEEALKVIFKQNFQISHNEERSSLNATDAINAFVEAFIKDS